MPRFFLGCSIMHGAELDFLIKRPKQVRADPVLIARVRKHVSPNARSVYLTGSAAAVGGAIKGRDVDLVVVGQEPKQRPFDLKLKGIIKTDISFLSLSDVQSAQWHPIKFILYRAGCLIAGADIVPLYRAPRTYLDCVVSCLYFHRDLIAFSKLNQSERCLAARWATKRTLRAAFEVIMPHAACFTADPPDCGMLAAAHLPQLSYLLSPLAELHGRTSWSAADALAASEMVRALHSRLGAPVDRLRRAYLSERLKERFHA